MSSKLQKNPSVVKTNERSRISSILLLIPLLVIVGIVPLIVFSHEYTTGLSQYSWYYSVTAEEDRYVDFFLYYKQWIFVCMAFLMFIILAARTFRNKKALILIKQCIPLGIYALLALLSTIFSKHAGVGFSGSFEQFENVFCLMGYALVVYYCTLIVQNEFEIRLVLGGLTVSVLIITLIGLGQTFGNDLYNSDIGKTLILPYGTDLSTVSVTMGEGRAYMTLYNPNYVGVYVALLFPIFLTLMFYSKNRKLSALYGLILVLLIICLYGSGSKAGFLVLVGVLLIYMLFMRKYLISHWKIFGTAAVVFIGIFLLLNLYKENAYVDSIINALKITPNTETELSSMYTTDDYVSMTFKGREIHISYSAENNIFNVTDADGSVLELNYYVESNQLRAAFADEAYSDIILVSVSDTIDYFAVIAYNSTYFFSNTVEPGIAPEKEPGTYYYYTGKSRWDVAVMADSAVFTNYDRLFSGRGYIWSRTIPQLSKYLIFGAGADNFVFAFPQSDHLKFLQNGYEAQVLTKPHSMYLQIGIQTGVLSLLSLLCFYGIYAVMSIKLYFKNKFDSFLSQMGVAIFIGSIGYMVAGISNDSTITIAPTFWTLIGLGLTINLMLIASKREALAKETAEQLALEAKDKKRRLRLSTSVCDN